MIEEEEVMIEVIGRRVRMKRPRRSVQIVEWHSWRTSVARIFIPMRGIARTQPHQQIIVDRYYS